jgi:GTPase SAR1 family protein
LLGNKNDMKEETKIKEEDIQKYCQEHNNMPYYSVSAMNNDNVEEAFTKVADLAFVRHTESDLVTLPDIKPILIQKEPEQKKGCC